MGSRLKNDEKFEKIVRGLAKLEHNRRCINCAALGPQYVCTSFSTFVCTNCSGIHREFTHRVKSISMAKFTATEVVALQAGGNQCAKEFYLQNWDAQRFPLPDSSSPKKLRDFIRAVYVDKRFAADKAEQKNRRGDGEQPLSNPSRSTSNPGSIRSSIENRSEDHRLSNRQMSSGSSDGGRYEDWSFEERASPFNGKRSPGKFEASDGRYDKNEQDKLFEDHFANEGPKNLGRFDRSKSDTSQNSYLSRQIEDQTSSNKHETRWSRDRPPNHRSYGGESLSPALSLREFLGEDVPKLHIESPTKSSSRSQSTGNIASSMAAPFRGTPKQRSVSFGSSGTAEGSSTDTDIGSTSLFKRANSDSLIDFSVDPGPPSASVKHELLVDATAQSTAEKSTTDWASFDTFPSIAPKVETFQPSSSSYGQLIPNGSNRIVAELHSDQVPASQNWQPSFQAWSSAYLSSVHYPYQSKQLHDELGHQLVQTQSFGPTQEPQKFSSPEVQGQPSPEGMLSPLISQSDFPNMGMCGESLFASGGLQYKSQGSEVALQGFVQRPKSKNPFDLPEDSASTTDFPNMVALQAALPQQLSGQFSASMMNATTHHNIYVGPYGHTPPLSYTPNASHGWSASGSSSFNMLLPPLQHQSIAPLWPDVAVGYQGETLGFAQVPGFSGQSVSQISQTPLNRTSSNPFA